MVGKHHWTKGERDALKQHYSAIPTSRLPALLQDRTSAAIRDQAHRMQLKKCEERIREMGRENVLKRWGPLKQPPEIQA